MSGILNLRGFFCSVLWVLLQSNKRHLNYMLSGILGWSTGYKRKGVQEVECEGNGIFIGLYKKDEYNGGAISHSEKSNVFITINLNECNSNNERPLKCRFCYINLKILEGINDQIL